MRMRLEWARPVRLKVDKKGGLMYTVALDQIPKAMGVYVFARIYKKSFEALYVGKADKSVRGRVKNHLNNLRLMNHVKGQPRGYRIVLAGVFKPRGGQKPEKCIPLIEKALIRHFLAEGHDLVNKTGTKIRRHEVMSSGKHPKRYFSKTIFLETR